jgi:hypothetical protein
MNDVEITETDLGLEECPLCAISHTPNAETIAVLESQDYSEPFDTIDDFFEALGI